MGDNSEAKAETRAMVAWVLDEILKLLHPFMPFMTEELWARMADHAAARPALLALIEWPRHEGLADPAADAEIGWVVELVSQIRSVRSEMNVPAGAKVPLVLAGGEQSDIRGRVGRNHDEIMRLARLDGISFEAAPPARSAVVMIGDTTAALPLEGIIDMAAEQKRLAREIEKTRSDRDKAAAWLANEANVAKSPDHVVELNRERVAEGSEKIARLEAVLRRLEG